jgi:Na+-transporting NADH:ubiquinone oxidoreductase subunit NqrB
MLFGAKMVLCALAGLSASLRSAANLPAAAHKTSFLHFAFGCIGTLLGLLLLLVNSPYYGWLQRKRELSEKVLSDFIKFV